MVLTEAEVMRLRTRFVVALVVVALVLSVTTLVGFTLYRDATVTQERAELRQTSDSVATEMDLVLGEKRESVRLWAQNDELGQHGRLEQSNTLATFVTMSSFSGASVIAANGTMTAMEVQEMDEHAERGVVGGDFSDRTYFRRAMAGETYVSDPIEAESGFLIVIVSSPLTEDGEPVGTFNAAFHIREGDMSKIVRASSTRTQHIRVVAGDVTVFSQGPTSDSVDANLVANTTVPSTGWTVSTTVSQSDFRSQLWTITVLQVGAFVLVLISLTLFGGWLYREYVGNVERIGEGFDALVDGEYGTQVALSGATEWERVGDQFNELSETLAQRRTEVTVLNRVLRHNLRNAMSVVMGNAERIGLRTDDDAVAADARRIERRGESLLELADHARTIESSLGTRDSETAARPVATVLAEVGRSLDDEFPAAAVTVDAEAAGDAAVPSGDLLVVVVDELARNGIVHADSDRPKVRLTASADEEQVTVCIADDGPGLPPVEKRVLTEPFVESPTQHGSGMGLWLVTWLVSQVDGEVAVETDDGTTVTLTLPRAESDESAREADARPTRTDGQGPE